MQTYQRPVLLFDLNVWCNFLDLQYVFRIIVLEEEEDEDGEDEEDEEEEVDEDEKGWYY